MTEIQAKFIGNPADFGTQQMGIKFGKKYVVTLKEAGLYYQLFWKSTCLAVIKTKRGVFNVPYTSRATFFNNWKVKKI